MFPLFNEIVDTYSNLIAITAPVKIIEIPQTKKTQLSKIIKYFNNLTDERPIFLSGLIICYFKEKYLVTKPEGEISTVNFNF